MAKNDYRHYQKVFNSVVRNQIPVTGTKYKKSVTEVIKDVNQYRQCYKKGDKTREQLPKYWFVSKEGFVINVRGKAPTWTKPNTESYRPEFVVSAKKKRYALTSYDLVGLVWDSYVSADAQKLLDRYGLKAFGSHKKKVKGQHSAKVQGHHKKDSYINDDSMKSYIANNRPDRIQLITNREHIILHSLTGDWEKDKQKFYRPDMLNVIDDYLKVYLPDDGAMMNPKDLVIKEVVDISMSLREQDSYIYEGYIFYLQNGREFLESNKNTLLDIVKTYPEHKQFEFNGEIIQYWKAE